MATELRTDAGMFLAAWPDMLDPNFMHSVVVMCQHSGEGAYGLITNRPTEYKLHDLLPEHEILKSSDFPVFLGGPVDHSALQFLHRVPDEIPGGASLDDTLWLGGELDAMARYVVADPERASANLKVFLGYAGWGAGQLESELITGSWIPASPTTEALFGPLGEDTWRCVVRSTGDTGRGLENQPPDVSWN